MGSLQSWFFYYICFLKNVFIFYPFFLHLPKLYESKKADKQTIMDSNVIEVNLMDLNNFAAIDNEEVVDYVVEEEEDEEAEELPMTMESCLLLNNVLYRINR